MLVKIQIKSIFGKVLFELERENNTIRETLEEAVRVDANLGGANLRDADLRYVKNKETATLPIFCKWNFGIKGNLIVIGCKEKTIEQWNLWFDSEEEYSTSRDTEDFKQIQAIYNALKSYYLTLNK